MIWFLILTIMPPQQLTWYEHFEQGEKHFRRDQYEACIEAMDAALAEKPESARNMITRAVQQIEYKPYYYKALCHFRLGNLFEAFEFAQRAYNGDVVQNSPILQSDLAEILAAYRRLVTDLNREYEQESAYIEERKRLLALLTTGDFEALEAGLAGVAEDARFEDIRANYAIQRQYRTSLNDLQTDIVNRFDQWIASGEWDKARSLLNDFSNNLPPEIVTRFRNDLDNLPSEPEPEETEPEITEEAPVEPLEEEASATPDVQNYLDDIEGYKRKVADLEQQRTEMNNLLNSTRSRNRGLRDELAQQQNKPAFKPRILLTLSKLAGTRVSLEGKIVSPFEIDGWQVSLNGTPMNIPSSAMEKSGNDYHLQTGFDAGEYGPALVSLKVWDDLAGSARASQSIVIPLPYYRNPQWWQFAAVLLLSIATLLALRLYRRRRKAKLRHFNPYIAGSPVRFATMFYGRDVLLNRIQNLVHKNSFMIHGERRIGKTSLLFQLKTNLSEMDSDDYRFYPVFIDLQGVLESDLFHHMMADVLQEAEDWDVEADGFTFNNDTPTYQSRHFSRDMKKLIQRLNTIDDRHAMVVLLVDEVDCLNEFSEKTNQKLRGIFMKDFAEHLTCVMAGIHLKREWESSGSPWYNFFEEIPLEPFDERYARQLITRPVKGIFTYRPEAVERILDRTGRHPYLIQKVCVSLIGRKLAEHRFRITADDVEAVLRNMKEEMQGIKQHELHNQ